MASPVATARTIAIPNWSWIGRLALVMTVCASAEGLPFQSDPQSGGQSSAVEYSDRGTLDMHVSDLPLSTFLELLSVQSKRNIIASAGVTGNVTAHLYDVDFEEALAGILASNNAGFIKRGKFIYVHTNEELAELRREPPVGRVFRLSYVSAIEAGAIIAPMLSDVGKTALSPAPEDGISSSSGSAGGQNWAGLDYVYVHDTPTVLEKIEATLKQIDIRPRQVLVEATILRANLTEDNALGIDFSLVGGVDLALLGATSNAITDLTLGSLPPERFELFNAHATTDFTGNLPPGGITVGIIKDQVAVFLQALEQITDTSVIANPKILALNKQKAQVIVGRRDGYLTTTFTNAIATQTIEFLETGTQLIFRPFIGDDGYIRVELHPEDSTGGVDSSGLPFEQTTEITTNVIVRDGHTILIGGLFRELTTDTRSQVPFLGDIPVLGTLFQSRQDGTRREEVIILLTIHIIKDDVAYSDASQEVMQDIERMRVGLRAGFMWHGRERLAQRHYRSALEHASDGESEKALWDINMALHNYPRFVPAIDFKESLLSKREWDDDAAAARHFLHRLIATETGASQRRFGRPAPEASVPDEVSPDAEDEPASPSDSQANEAG